MYPTHLNSPFLSVSWVCSAVRLANRGKHSLGMLSPRDFMRWILQLLTAMPSDPDIWGLETAWQTCLGPRVDDWGGFVACLPHWKSTHIQKAENRVSGIWVSNFATHCMDLRIVKSQNMVKYDYTVLFNHLLSLHCQAYVMVPLRVYSSLSIDRSMHVGRWKVVDSAQAFHGVPEVCVGLPN